MTFRAGAAFLAALAGAVFVHAATPRPPLPLSYGSPSWSPDGRELVFVGARGRAGALVLANLDESETRRLVPARLPFQVAWSPRGDRIAYVTNAGVFVIRSDGSAKQRVGFGGDLAWAPDGSRLAFDQGGIGPIYVVDLDGGGRTWRTKGKYDYAPAWSPDGRLLVFARSRRAGLAESLFVIGSDGNGVRPLGIQGTMPAWSPDGGSIAFWRKTPDGVALAVARADGTRWVPLTRSLPAFSGAPRWSPDGHRLLFTVCTAGPCRIDVGDPDGGSVIRLANGGEAVWAPDGTRIAFANRRGCRTSGIFLMNADGSGVTPVTPCR